MAKKEEKTNRKEISKNKKSYWKDFKAELKRVVWPSPKQLVNSTIAVVTIVLITAAIVFVLDLTFETLNKYGIENVKKVIENSQTIENVTSEDNKSTEENTAADNTTSEENVENSTENNVAQ